MNLTEIIKKYGSTIDTETIDFIEAVLFWKSQNGSQPERSVLGDVLKKLVNACRKSANVQSLDHERQILVDEIARLNSYRQKLTAQISELNVKRLQHRQEYEEAEQKLQAKQRWFDELERVKNEINHLPQEQSRLEKEITELKTGSADMKRKYDATKHLVDELRQNRWLDPKIKDSILKIWKTLPADELDETVEKQHKK
jgi:chromosome segregation ATPase